MPSALPAVPFLGAALVLATLPHHWRVGNLATLSIIAWLTAYELILGVNAVLWDGNVTVKAQVWCDISTKIQVGAKMALPGCCLCMAKRLNRIAYGLDMSPRGWKHRILDIALCWGFPLLIMVLHYVVQGHRFDIIENIGCMPAVYISIESLLILAVSAFIPSILTLLFCFLALIKLLRRRIALSSVILLKPNPNLTTSRYIRLMVMTFALGSWSAILVSVSAANDYNSGLLPYKNWAYVHVDFSFVGQYSIANLYANAPDDLRCLFILWAAVSVSALAFFLFFGIGADVAKDYVACWRWVRAVVLRHPYPKPEPSMVESVIWANSLDAESKYHPRLEDGTWNVVNIQKDLPPLPPSPPSS